MSNTDNQNISPTLTMADTLKSWVMVIISLIFVLLYAGAVSGWISTADAIKELQPIVFVIIGYYFGRLPAQQNENSLKEQISNESNKTDEANKDKEEALKGKAASDGKMDAVKATLTRIITKPAEGAGPAMTEATDPNREAVETALMIMNS